MRTLLRGSFSPNAVELRILPSRPERSELLLRMGRGHYVNAVPGQPLRWPGRASDDESLPYAYWLCILQAGGQVSAAATRDGQMEGAETQPVEQLPGHIYWGFCAGKQRWLPCVHVGWYAPDSRGDGTYKARGNRSGKSHIAWCHEIAPVELSGWSTWQRTGTSVVVSSDTDCQIRRFAS